MDWSHSVSDNKVGAVLDADKLAEAAVCCCCGCCCGCGTVPAGQADPPLLPVRGGWRREGPGKE